MVGFICFVLSSQSYLSEGEKKDSFASSLFLYEKENIEIVLAGVQLKKKCIDFRSYLLGFISLTINLSYIDTKKEQKVVKRTLMFIFCARR